MLIRDELPDDVTRVRQVIAAAFGGPAEADLVDALRESGDTVISLVAEDGGAVVGQVVFSRLRAPEGCLALAPVSVAEDRRNRGIGAALILEGLARARRGGWQAVFVVGEPAYYARFGFGTEAAKGLESDYAGPFFLALELRPGALAGETGAVVYPPAFLDPAL